LMKALCWEENNLWGWANFPSLLVNIFLALPLLETKVNMAKFNMKRSDFPPQKSLNRLIRTITFDSFLEGLVKWIKHSPSVHQLNRVLLISIQRKVPLT
jgi:hypothetical protein